MPSMLNDMQRNQLRDIARQSITSGVNSGQPLTVSIDDFERIFRKNRATFVTIRVNSSLRGCIGSLQATRPLVNDVAENAYAAALRDTRFSSISEKDLSDMEVSISVLSQTSEVNFIDEGDLISQLNPGTDGLVLEEGSSGATFLPVVWESLPDPQDFIQQLKIKAGLSEDYWSDRVKVSRYTAECF